METGQKPGVPKLWIIGGIVGCLGLLMMAAVAAAVGAWLLTRSPEKADRGEDADTTAEDGQTIAGSGKPFGSRDARACGDTKTSGSKISEAVAKRAFLCYAENLSGDYIYLVEEFDLEIGGGRDFQVQSDVNYSEIDVSVPIYPLRGSFTRYQCSAESDILQNYGRNCNVYENPNATGSCYKTTFGDWRCSMMDLTTSSKDFRSGLPPPK